MIKKINFSFVLRHNYHLNPLNLMTLLAMQILLGKGCYPASDHMKLIYLIQDYNKGFINIQLKLLRRPRKSHCFKKSHLFHMTS